MNYLPIGLAVLLAYLAAMTVATGLLNTHHQLERLTADVQAIEQLTENTR